MSKKHFIALADALRATRPKAVPLEDRVWQWQRDVEAVAEVCAASNSLFNRHTWLGYIYGECGPSGGAVKGAKS